MTRAQFVAFVRAAGQGVVATVDGGGNPEAALVGLAVTDEGELIFDSLTDTRKIANIRVHPRVALVIGWDDGVSVQLEGQADVLAASERDLYGQVYLSQFPHAGVFDEGFAVVRVVPEWLRYYDASQQPALVIEQPCWRASGPAMTMPSPCTMSSSIETV